MAENILLNKEQAIEELKQTTIYPSGKNNRGEEPVTAENINGKSKDWIKKNGYRVASGFVATVAAASLLRDPEITPDPTALNQAIGTVGEVLMFAGGVIGAMGREHAQELGRDIKEAWNEGKEARREFRSELKTSFVSGVANIRKAGQKVSKKLQSYTRRTIADLKKDNSSEVPFEIYRPKQNGEEGVELAYSEFTKRKGRG